MAFFRRMSQVFVGATFLALVTAVGVPTFAADDKPASDTKAASPKAPVAQPPVGAPKAVDLPGLHNVVAYHKGFLSGSVPEGAAGFDTLVAMGVKTIISVDGAEPDLAEAKRRGIRYVHLPIGYSGFDEVRKLEMTRAVRDLAPDGPIYIHCHHGKHRSAGAAGTIAVSLGWVDNAEAERLMKVSGTASNYVGLYKCAAEAKPLTAEQINAAPSEFPEVSRPSGFVKSMVAIDEANEHLKAIEKAGWKVPKDHPDLVPAAEAGRIADLFRALCDDGRAKSKPADFASGLRTSGEQLQALEDMLAKNDTDAKRLSAQFALVNTSCKDCHARYRD